MLTKIFYPSGPNLVILGWTSDALPHKQARGSQAHTTHTDAGNDNNRRSKTHIRGNEKIMVMMIILLIKKILIAIYVIFMVIAIVISCTDWMLSIFWGWQTWLQYKYKIQSKPCRSWSRSGLCWWPVGLNKGLKIILPLILLCYC